MRWVLALLTFALLIGGGLWVAAGRGAPPTLAIDQPDRFLGQNGTLEVTAGAPGTRFTSLTVALEQDGRETPLFSLDTPDTATLVQVDADHLRIAQPLGKQTVPSLQSGPARIIVRGSRPSLLNLRTLTSETVKDVEVRLDPPRVSLVSTHHYINHGGSELVVYRVSPDDVESGVRVGDIEYPGYPASRAGIPDASPDLRVAVFALLFDQDLRADIRLFARDPAGNTTTAPFIDNVFSKPVRRSRIAVDDRFFSRVVPGIVERTPTIDDDVPEGDLLGAFLAINGRLRQENSDQIAEIASKTADTKLWEGPFTQLGNSKVEASFADHRTYLYQGREVDQQVHLGFDLAVTAAVPILAANAGRVLHADWLGIYGNCIIIDHGLGVASLYAHLSSIQVAPGDTVAKGQTLGRSGTTGLAAGDHLHFTMLVGGRPVNPVEWWDPIWMRDRVERKLVEAGRTPVAP